MVRICSIDLIYDLRAGLVPDDDDDQLMFETQPLDEVSEPTAPRRRRRRLVVDRVTEIPHDQLRAQVNDTSALVNRVMCFLTN